MQNWSFCRGYLSFGIVVAKNVAFQLSKKSPLRISSIVRSQRSQMACPILRFSVSATFPPNIPRNSINILQPFLNFQQFNRKNTSFGYRCSLFCCYAAAKQQKSGSPPPTKKKRKPSSKSNGKRSIEDDFVIEKSSSGGVGVLESDSDSELESSQSQYGTLPLPKPPAGFVLDGQGRVLMASDRRIATIVDSSNNSPLECVIRRVFRNSRGDECMLLCPVDTPVQILKSVNNEGWSAVSDNEVEGILPSAAYALAKIHMHLVYSGFCYTARGGFCYTEEDIFEFHIDKGEDVDGLPTEGVEIVCFNRDGSHYMIYTPSDPLLFVAVKDKNGVLQIADDELLEDPAVISAIDEETEFNALVEEEAALLDSLIGKR